MKAEARRIFLALLDPSDPPALDATARASSKSEADVVAAVKAIALETEAPGRSQHLLALALLWHDHLDASHNISQDLKDADGSYVHALMHRREGDYENTKYWIARVGKHAVYGQLGKPWDANAMVDRCQKAVAAGGSDAELIDLQRREYLLLAESFFEGEEKGEEKKIG
jgi:hypothetical protein